MFQTALNHFLQSFASDELTAFMRFITGLGYTEFLMIFLLILLFIVDFKKTFLLFMILFWTGVITFFLKDYFDLPRPFHVDNTLQFLDGQLPGKAKFDFSERGAKFFWGTLPADVLEVTRQTEGVENGFPSGHSSIAIALWGALIFLFRERWVRVIAITLMILIPLSRMYLGVHFLADVISGITLGGIILGIFHRIVLKPDKLSAFLVRENYTIGFNPISILLLVCPLFFLLILPPRIYVLVAYMLGFGASFLFLSKKGLPNSEAPIPQRIGRMFVAGLCFIAFHFILKFVAEQVGLAENVWIGFLRNLMESLALMWLGVVVGIRFGWFRRG